MRYLLILFVALSMASCTDAPNFNDVPALTFDGLIRDTLAQSTDIDTVYIKLTITDANGDIGETDNGQASVFLTDERDGFEQPPFILPRISQQGTGKGIKAEVTLLFRAVKGEFCCRYPDGTGGCFESTQFPLDSLFYDTYVVDHAGNESNHVRVGPIYLICDSPN